MKKGFYYLVASFIFAFVAVTNVSAANISLSQTDLDTAKATPGVATDKGIVYTESIYEIPEGNYVATSNLVLGDDGLKFGNGTSVIDFTGYTISSNYTVLNLTNSEITINGGTFTSTGDAVVRVDEVKLTINGGTFDTKSGASAMYVFNFAVGNTVTINDGVFSSVGDNGLETETSTSITINGGKFTGGAYGIVGNPSAFILTGGTYTGGTGAISTYGSDVEPLKAFLADGYKYSKGSEIGKTEFGMVYLSEKTNSVVSETTEEEKTDTEETKGTDDKKEKDEIPTYNYLEGNGQEYDLNSEEGASFRIDADYTLFENGKVYVDDNEVDKKNYTSKEGSTIITLTKEFMSTLTEGSHTLKVVFNNEGVATTSFTVKAETKEAANEIKEETTTKSINPKTGDNIIKYITLLILSVIGIGIVLNKRIIHNN